MALFLSPGVFPREIDLSVLPAGVGPLRPVFIGTASKGAINEPTFVSTAQQAIEEFGEPFPDSSLMYAVLAYMEEGNQAYILRVGVECEDGQADELADICIDTSGNRVQGWGRIPFYTGIDFGRIQLRDATTDAPYEFHIDDVFDETYNDLEVSTTDGPTSASIAISGTYTGAIDDSFIVLITTDPDPSFDSPVGGAGYQVIRNSDGVIVSDGILVESASPGVSESFDIGEGDEASGLSAVITVTSGVLEANDTFTFKVRPDNTTFAIEVEGVASSPVSFSFTDGATYATNADFADAFNTLVGSSVDFIAVATSETELHIRTRTAGERIQVVDTEGWALEVGIAKYAYDIPRSFLISTDSGPYLISTANNRVNTLVIGDDDTQELEVTIPVGSSVPAASVAAALDLGGIASGDQFYEAFALQVTDDDFQVVMVTVAAHQFSTLKMQADFSHVQTARFAAELSILFPYTRNYRGFSDSRLSLPDTGSITPSSPASCEDDPGSDECAADSAYFENIVGFLIAKSPGTWIEDYTINLTLFGETGGRFTLELYDDQGILVERIEDLSFDPREARYIANLLNAGGTLAGVNGNKWFEWEERPAFLGNDPDDESTFAVRTPSQISSREFAGMANGIPPSAEFSSELDRAIIGNPAFSTGIYAFQNPETFDVNLLVIPGISSGAVIAQGLQLCESRGDMLFIIDPPFGLRPQQVVDWHNGMLLSDLTAAINSSYGALYWSYVKIFDQFNGGEIFIPPSGHVASVFSRTARVAEQWFAPAGLNRGRLLTALDVEFSPTQGERDLLYGSGNAVNPIVNFPQDGIVVFGQRTLQRRASALDRVNVRMLLIFIKKNLVRTLRNFLFEPNDRFLWAQVRNTIDPFLADIAARRGLTAFKTICDETNNTPERIDRNELWVTVLLKPTRTVEFIVLNLVVLRTDASFTADEVLAAGGVVITQANAI